MGIFSFLKKPKKAPVETTTARYTTDHIVLQDASKGALCKTASPALQDASKGAVCRTGQVVDIRYRQ